LWGKQFIEEWSVIYKGKNKGLDGIGPIGAPKKKPYAIARVNKAPQIQLPKPKSL
jgi:hypothetical protein